MLSRQEKNSCDNVLDEYCIPVITAIHTSSARPYHQNVILCDDFEARNSMAHTTQALVNALISQMSTLTISQKASISQKLAHMWQSPINQNRGGTLIQKLSPENFKKKCKCYTNPENYNYFIEAKKQFYNAVKTNLYSGMKFVRSPVTPRPFGSLLKDMIKFRTMELPGIMKIILPTLICSKII
uniref:Uncharacterized protein n=1 Tax=Glossina pallidipes TaxID=7398 RepID=A0A1A9ZZE9_GLOPL